jgi:hypothetical protein
VLLFVLSVSVDWVENGCQAKTGEDFYWPENGAENEEYVEVGFLFAIPVACGAEFATKGFKREEYPAKARVFSRFHYCFVPNSMIFIGDVGAGDEIANDEKCTDDFCNRNERIKERVDDGPKCFHGILLCVWWDPFYATSRLGGWQALA